MNRSSSYWRSLNPRTGARRASALTLAFLPLFLFFPGLVSVAHSQIYVENYSTTETASSIGEYTTSGAAVNASLIPG